MYSLESLRDIRELDLFLMDNTPRFPDRDVRLRNTNPVGWIKYDEKTGEVTYKENKAYGSE